MPAKRPNIIIICFDGLRADHLGCYGYHGPVSPYIDEFAKENVLFKKAFSQSNWTLPSVASIFTGLYPTAHGAHKNPFLKGSIVQKLSSNRKTLAEILKEIGYRTGAFGCIGYLDRSFGLNRGFDVYVGHRLNPISTFMGKGKRLKHSIKEFLSWLKLSNSGRPLFSYFHCWDTHEPFIGHRRFLKEMKIKYRGKLYPMRSYFSYMLSSLFVRNRFKNLNWVYANLINKGEITLEASDVAFIKALYDAEIRFVDRSFGMFIKELKKKGIYENSLIILLADHGNEFYEQYKIGHGDSLYNEALHVPLIIKFPETEGLKNIIVDEYVELIDIMPTLLEYLSVETSLPLQGKSLLSLVKGAPPKQVKVFFENVGLFRHAMICNGWKLICYRIGTGVDLNYRLLYDSKIGKKILVLKDVDIGKGIFFSIHNRKAIVNKKVTLHFSIRSYSSQCKVKVLIGNLFEEQLIVNDDWQTFSSPVIQVPKRLHQNDLFIRILSCDKGTSFMVGEIRLIDNENGNVICCFSFEDEDLYTYELYNLKDDPMEKDNLFFKKHRKAEEMKNLLKAQMQENIKLSKEGRASGICQDKKLQQQLKSLGYID